MECWVLIVEGIFTVKLSKKHHIAMYMKIYINFNIQYSKCGTPASGDA